MIKHFLFLINLFIIYSFEVEDNVPLLENIQQLRKVLDKIDIDIPEDSVNLRLLKKKRTDNAFVDQLEFLALMQMFNQLQNPSSTQTASPPIYPVPASVYTNGYYPTNVLPEEPPVTIEILNYNTEIIDDYPVYGRQQTLTYPTSNRASAYRRQ